jgi:hypothetical protein
VAGEYKAVLELAAALNKQLLPAIPLENNGILTLTESNLRCRIKEDPHGGSMTYETSLLTSDDKNDDDAGTGFRGFLRKEGWWVVSILAFLGTGCGLFLSGFLINSWPCFSLSATLIFTMCVGSTGKSRIFIFLWLFLFFFAAVIVPLVLITNQQQVK